jgi:voltage-gated potassium channel
MAGESTAGAEDPTARAVRRLNRRLLILTGFAAALLLLCPLGFWLVEHERNPNVRHLSSGYQWLFRTLFEATSPYKIRTGPGFALYYLVRIAGVSLVAFTSGTIASRLVNNVIMKGRGMGSTKATGHLLILGWSPKGHEVLRELRAKEVEEKRPIVILATLDASPTKDHTVEFLRGDPTDADDLQRAGLPRVDSAILLADESTPSQSAGDRDARTLLTCLAVESISPEVYTCVEILRSENRIHFQRTQANELVVSGELTGALLAGSARTRGLSRMVVDLVTHPEGHEFTRLTTPDELVGTSVRDAMLILKDRYDTMLVGVLDNAGQYEVNPPGDRLLDQDHDLLVISRRPDTVPT